MGVVEAVDKGENTLRCFLPGAEPADGVYRLLFCMGCLLLCVHACRKLLRGLTGSAAMSACPAGRPSLEELALTLTTHGGRGSLSIRKSGNFRWGFALAYCPLLWYGAGGSFG